MTPAPVIPIPEQAQQPTWTIHRDGPPTPEGIRALARLCLQVARKRLERARAEAERQAAGEQEHKEQDV
jgi:hypothetical protein